MFMENLFRSFVEDGSIVIGDRPSIEIIQDFDDRVLAILSDPEYDLSRDMAPVIDHQHTLLDRATTEARGGDSLIAITFYVIWFEHYINGALIRAFRKMGHDATSYMPMVRQLNVVTKLTSAWALAGLPTVDDEQVKLLSQAVEMRNAFVHYKWPALDFDGPDKQKERADKIAEELPNLVAYFESLEDQAFWSGRENQIISDFRADQLAREARNPAPYPSD